MPFQSSKQRSYMYANHPQIAKRWQAVTPPGKLPTYKKDTLTPGDKTDPKKKKRRRMLAQFAKKHG